jgi:hypothetical protein
MKSHIHTSIKLKLFLLFIPAAYFSSLFHEFGHWTVGEILGNDMAFNLNYTWAKAGHYIDDWHDLYVSIGGPAFSVLQSLIFLLIIEKYKSFYAFPFMFFPMFMRFFSLVFGGFDKQDEARISALLGIGTYTFAIIIVVLLILIVWKGSRTLKITMKEIGYYVTMSTGCQLLVIGTYTVL